MSQSENELETDEYKFDGYKDELDYDTMKTDIINQINNVREMICS